MTDETLSNLSREDRRFEPPADLAENANVKEEAYERAASDREAFWAEAAERLDWDTKWDRVVDWDNPPFAKWYVGGKLNAAYNCVDRHVEAGNGDKVAFHWVGEPEDDTRDITYAELKDQVCQAANALTDLGVKAGDRVAIYMPMIPETVVAMLACARIGAPHTVVFGGFSSTRAPRPDPGLRRPGRDHLRRRLPARGAVGPQAGRRRGLRAVPRRPQRGRGQAHRPGGRLGRRPRRVVGRHGRQGVDRPHPRGVRRRAPALRDVHVGHDGQAEGDPAHDGRLPGRDVVHALGGLRPQAGEGRLLDRGRHRLGHRALLHRLRPARQRRDVGDVRGHARHPPQGALVGHRRAVQGHDPLLRPHRDPHLHEVGVGDPGEGRPVLAAAARLGR